MPRAPSGYPLGRTFFYRKGGKAPTSRPGIRRPSWHGFAVRSAACMDAQPRSSTAASNDRAQILDGLSVRDMAQMFLVTATLLALSTAVFQAGLRRYGSASS